MRRTVWIALAVLAAAGVAGAAPVRKPVTHATAAARDWTRVIVATPDGGVRMGNPAAKVSVIEYGSRTCPHCAHFEAEGLPALKANYIARGRVSYEFRDFPVHDALDLAPILLGHCGGTARFFPLLDAMMARQDTLIGRKTAIPPADLETLRKATPNQVAGYLGKFYGYLELATRNGIPPARARACLADPAALKAIATRAAAADQMWKIAQTPTFIVDGKATDASDWATLEPLLKAAGAQ